ncbi:MAG: radical SAM protein, partial [Niabella sp.]|nr:radical SAM protein [Niabella sp.]
PCNPDALVMGYALKLNNQVFALTRYIDPAQLLDNSRNTIVYEQDDALKEKMIHIFSTGISVERVEENMNQLLCCLPQIQAPGLTYNNLFRIIIMRFIDAYDFDVRAIKKSCVHIVHKDGRLIPFETMNLLYRDEKLEYLETIR